MLSSYLLPLRQLMEAYADPEKAPAMKRYMQDQFEFYGIQAQDRKTILKSYISKAGLPNIVNAGVVLKEIWEQPQREYQYMGCALTEKLIKKAPPDFIEILEFMVTHKPWWDTVDTITSNLIGTHFKRYPELINDFSHRWVSSGNMWLQRSSILFQLKYKANTDEKLLYDLILQLKDSKEFFIRKAIGWALREYSKSKPDSVIEFVDETTLSGLSRREALKWLRNKNIQ